MTESRRPTETRGKINALSAVLSTAACALLVFLPWSLPVPLTPSYWNAVAVFALTAILCDSWLFTSAFANLSGSIVFVPLFATVLLFGHPVPMVIASLTAWVVETLVMHKPAHRVWFNVAQFSVAIGLASVVYSALGGHVGLNDFSFKLVPFAGLVVTYFLVNQGSVALAVALSSGITVRESWDRIGGGARAYDILASSLAILLAFLYVKLQFLGLAIVVLPLFMVRQLYQMNVQLQSDLEEKLELMVKAIEARDPYTSGHSRRVAEYAVAMARDLGLSAREVDGVKRAALLHDVGKIYEEFAPLLRKEAKLSMEERIVMQTHVVRSAELVGTVAKLRGPVLEAIRHHHENFDGSGYPDGLGGEDIPIGARIIMIGDTIDAMTTDRPYRRALTLPSALAELAKYAGKQFDPRLVKLVSESPAIRRLLEPQSSPVVSPEGGYPSVLRGAPGGFPARAGVGAT